MLLYSQIWRDVCHHFSLKCWSINSQTVDFSQYHIFQRAVGFTNHSMLSCAASLSHRGNPVKASPSVSCPVRLDLGDCWAQGLTQTVRAHTSCEGGPLLQIKSPCIPIPFTLQPDAYLCIRSCCTDVGNCSNYSKTWKCDIKLFFFRIFSYSEVVQERQL